MGFWGSLYAVVQRTEEKHQEEMAWKVCRGNPIRTAPQKVAELISLIERKYPHLNHSSYEFDEVNRQRVAGLRLIMAYLSRKAVSDRQADEVRLRIINDHGAKLKKLGVKV